MTSPVNSKPVEEQVVIPVPGQQPVTPVNTAASSSSAPAGQMISSGTNGSVDKVREVNVLDKITLKNAAIVSGVATGVAAVGFGVAKALAMAGVAAGVSAAAMLLWPLVALIGVSLILLAANNYFSARTVKEVKTDELDGTTKNTAEAVAPVVVPPTAQEVRAQAGKRIADLTENVVESVKVMEQALAGTVKLNPSLSQEEKMAAMSKLAPAKMEVKKDIAELRKAVVAFTASYGEKEALKVIRNSIPLGKETITYGFSKATIDLPKQPLTFDMVTLIMNGNVSTINGIGTGVWGNEAGFDKEVFVEVAKSFSSDMGKMGIVKALKGLYSKLSVVESLTEVVSEVGKDKKEVKVTQVSAKFKEVLEQECVKSKIFPKLVNSAVTDIMSEVEGLVNDGILAVEGIKAEEMEQASNLADNLIYVGMVKKEDGERFTKMVLDSINAKRNAMAAAAAAKALAEKSDPLKKELADLRKLRFISKRGVLAALNSAIDAHAALSASNIQLKKQSLVFNSEVTAIYQRAADLAHKSESIIKASMAEIESLELILTPLDAQIQAKEDQLTGLGIKVARNVTGDVADLRIEEKREILAALTGQKVEQAEPAKPVVQPVQAVQPRAVVAPKPQSSGMLSRALSGLTAGASAAMARVSALRRANNPEVIMLDADGAVIPRAATAVVVEAVDANNA